MSSFMRRRCIAIALSLGLTALPARAQQPVEAQQYPLRLPAQALADSLRALGKTAHVNIVFEPQRVQGLRAPPLEGEYTPAEALARLLAGSGLVMRRTAGGSWAVESGMATTVAAADTPRPEPVATADTPSPSRDGVHTFDPLLVLGKAEGFSMTRMPTALKDIPQSVSVIGRESWQEQNAFDLAAVLNRATGVTLSQAGSTGNHFYARGFAIGTLHVDGGAPTSLSLGNESYSILDLSQYERLEVLRGADALFGGSGDPSGSLNLARKRPLAEAAASIAISAGSWSNYRAEVDLSDRITRDGRLRGRLVAAHHDQEYFYDNAQRRMNKLYAVFDYDLRPATRLTLGGSTEKANYIPVPSGLPRYSDGADPHLRRSTGLTLPWAKNTARTNEVFAQLEHGFSERWRLKAGVTRTVQDQEGLMPILSSSINPVTHLQGGQPTVNDQDSTLENTAVDLTLTGSFDWNGRAQEILFGADRARISTGSETLALTLSGPRLNPFDFHPDRYSVPTVGPFAQHIQNQIQMTQYGIYGALKLRPAERWALTVGARNNFMDSAIHVVARLGPIPLVDRTVRSSESGVVTPYAGLVYELNPRYSLYASYADVFKPNSFRTRSGGMLDPQRGTNLEAGVKGTWNEGRLNGSLALFKIDLDNFPENDPNTPPSIVDACCFIGVSQRSKGVEAELSGLLAPGWQLSAGYTFNINRKSDGSTLSTITPRHLMKAWTSYQLPGNARGWSIGGGLNAQTGSYSQSTACTAFGPTGLCIGGLAPYRLTQGFYAVTTVRVDYRLSDSWNLALNVDNLFDRRYYQTISNPNGSNWYGAPRNGMLSLRGQF